MVVNFAPLNADWGLAHIVINSVCFAFSVVLTLYDVLLLMSLLLLMSRAAADVACCC